MHGAEARTRQHRDDGLRHHRHIDEHAVALLDSELPECPSKPRDLVPELSIRVGPNRAGDRAIVDERWLLPAPAIDVSVEGVITGVERASHEPTVEGLPRVIENTFPPAVPVDILGSCCPETLRFSQRESIDVAVGARHPRALL
jgi:hypothetical protein